MFKRANQQDWIPSHVANPLVDTLHNSATKGVVGAGVGAVGAAYVSHKLKIPNKLKLMGVGATVGGTGGAFHGMHDSAAKRRATMVQMGLASKEASEMDRAEVVKSAFQKGYEFAIDQMSKDASYTAAMQQFYEDLGHGVRHVGDLAGKGAEAVGRLGTDARAHVKTWDPETAGRAATMLGVAGGGLAIGRYMSEQEHMDAQARARGFR